MVLVSWEGEAKCTKGRRQVRGNVGGEKENAHARPRKSP